MVILSATQSTSLNMRPRGEKEKEDDPGNNWHRELEADVKETGFTWRELERLAQDRSSWRCPVGGPCPRRGDEGFD